MYLIRPSRTPALSSADIERIERELEALEWELSLEGALEFSRRHDVELNLENERGQNAGYVRPNGDYSLREAAK